MRFEAIDKGHRITEIQLDGICTHIETAKNCPLKGTVFHLKLNEARQAIRSSRDIFRNDMGMKQPTLTTRGGTNRHGLWECPVYPDWVCPFCHMERIVGTDLRRKCTLVEMLVQDKTGYTVYRAESSKVEYKRNDPLFWKERGLESLKDVKQPERVYN